MTKKEVCMKCHEVSEIMRNRNGKMGAWFVGENGRLFLGREGGRTEMCWGCDQKNVYYKCKHELELLMVDDQ